MKRSRTVELGAVVVTLVVIGGAVAFFLGDDHAGAADGTALVSDVGAPTDDGPAPARSVPPQPSREPAVPQRLDIPTLTEARPVVVDDGLSAGQRLAELWNDLGDLGGVATSRQRPLLARRVETYLLETRAARQEQEARALLAGRDGTGPSRSSGHPAPAGLAIARAALGDGGAVLDSLRSAPVSWRADIVAALAWDPAGLHPSGLELAAEPFSVRVHERRERKLLPIVCTRPPGRALIEGLRRQLARDGRTDLDRRVDAAALLVLGVALDREPDVVLPILRDVVDGGDTTRERAALWVLARGRGTEARAAFAELLRETVDIEGLDASTCTDRMLRLLAFARALDQGPAPLSALHATLRDGDASSDERLRAAVSLLAVTQDDEGSLEDVRAAQQVLVDVLATEDDEALVFAELGALCMSLELERLSRGLSIGFGSPDAPEPEHEEAVRVALERRLFHDLRPQHRALAALALRDFATEPAASRARDTLHVALRNESDAEVRERIRIALGRDG